MFGKGGGGALSTWIKEFCELVFIQTLQAFIYAMVIGVIMNMNVAAMENSDQATVLGFMCVVCLTSIFKVEEILRRLFGFGPTKADHGNAVKSIAKTAFAVKLGKRVLDNGGKIVGGAKNMIGANKDAKKASDRLQRRKKALDADYGMGENPDSNSRMMRSAEASSTAGSLPAGSQQRKIDSNKRSEKIRLFNEAQKARKLAQTEADPNKKKALMEQAKLKMAQSRAIDDTLKSNDSDNSGIVSSEFTVVPAQGRSSTGTSSTPIAPSQSGASSAASNGSRASSSSNASVRGGGYYQALENLKEQYEGDLSNAKKRRKEGLRTMTRGFAETAGAVIGGTAGAILGVADGNIDEGLQGMVGGAGVGDLVGGGAAGAVFGTKDLLEGVTKSTKKALTDYGSNIKSQYEEEKKNAEAQIRELNKNAANEVNRMNANAEKARDELEKEINMSAGQTAKVIAKSVKKGTVKAYNSRHGGIRQLENNLKDLESNIKSSSAKINLVNDVESID